MELPIIIYKASAGPRICDTGNWTDTDYTKDESGYVTSFGIDLRTHVSLIPKDGSEVKIISENLETQTTIKDFRQIEYKGTLDLLVAAVKVMDINQGFTARIRADAPPGCGVGTSAAVAVALLGALHGFMGKEIDRAQIAAMAQRLETEELGLLCGVQDQYAAAFGGWNYMKIDYPDVEITPINAPDWLIAELESRLILVYFGPRSSSKQHAEVFPGYERGEERVVEGMDLLRKSGTDMREALIAADLNAIPKVMNQNWEAAKMLSSDSQGFGITTKQIEWVHELAFENGAIGFDVNGAAGGGSASILAGQGREHELRKALEGANIQVLPFNFDFRGLQVWEVEA